MQGIMNRSKWYLGRMSRSVGSVFAGCALALGCGAAATSDSKNANENQVTPDQVGEQCIPFEESDPEFPGFGEGSNLGFGATDCASGVCLSINFTGRVSCPSGQTAQALGLPASDPSRCKTPDGTLVTVAVSTQLPSEPPSERVICSCRCDSVVTNPCTCPSNMQCIEIWPPSTTPDGRQIGGSYCVYPNTAG